MPREAMALTIEEFYETFCVTPSDVERTRRRSAPVLDWEVPKVEQNGLVLCHRGADLLWVSRLAVRIQGERAKYRKLDDRLRKWESPKTVDAVEEIVRYFRSWPSFRGASDDATVPRPPSL
jgi:hypothetical protein